MTQMNYYKERDKQNLKKINELIQELPPFCKDFLRGIAIRTRVLTRLKYAYDLRIFFHFLTQEKFRDKQVKEITLEMLNDVNEYDIENFLNYLSSYEYNGKVLSCDERAKARKLSAVRSLFKYFFKKDDLDSNIASKVDTPKLHEKEIIRLDGAEVSELLSVAETGRGLSKHAEAYHRSTKVRDTAILTLFLGTGIRISELVGLNNESIDFKHNSFKVVRKGGNEATLYFSDEVADALREYMDQKKGNPEIPKKEKALFLSLRNTRLTVRAVEVLVKKYSKVVTPLKHITPHKLRSTYGTALYRETGDIYIVADVLGHKDVNTTRKHYAAISEDNRRNVAGKVKLRANTEKNDEEE